MFVLFKKILRDNRKTLISYGIGLFIYSFLVLIIYPSIQSSIGSIEDYMKNLPESFLAAFGMKSLDYFTFNGYVAGEYLNLMWIIIILFFIASFAGRIVAGEVEKGTIELLLARPISRIKIALAYISAFLLGILILEAATVLGFWLPHFWVNSFTIDWLAIINAMLMLLFFSLAIFGYSFLFSCLFSNKGKVVALSASLTLVFYIINFLYLYWDHFAWLRHFTLFYYYRGADLLMGKSIILTDVLLYLAVFFVCIGIGLWYFNRRDICVK